MKLILVMDWSSFFSHCQDERNSPGWHLTSCMCSGLRSKTMSGPQPVARGAQRRGVLNATHAKDMRACGSAAPPLCSSAHDLRAWLGLGQATRMGWSSSMSPVPIQSDALLVIDPVMPLPPWQLYSKLMSWPPTALLARVLILNWTMAVSAGHERLCTMASRPLQGVSKPPAVRGVAWVGVVSVLRHVTTVCAMLCRGARGCGPKQQQRLDAKKGQGRVLPTL